MCKSIFVPFQDENNRQAGLIVVIQDITEHVKLDNMRKEFVADVSHELKRQLHLLWGMRILYWRENMTKIHNKILRCNKFRSKKNGKTCYRLANSF